MDFTPLIAPSVTALIAAGGTYAALTSRIARLEARVEYVERQQEGTSSLSAQIAALSQKVDDLREDVRRHNGVVERTVELEQSTKAAWHQINSLKADIDRYHKAGGPS